MQKKKQIAAAYRAIFSVHSPGPTLKFCIIICTRLFLIESQDYMSYYHSTHSRSKLQFDCNASQMHLWTLCRSNNAHCTYHAIRFVLQLMQVGKLQLVALVKLQFKHYRPADRDRNRNHNHHRSHTHTQTHWQCIDALRERIVRKQFTSHVIQSRKIDNTIEKQIKAAAKYADVANKFTPS